MEYPPPPIPSPPLVAILSDMGSSDWYVGVMKGVVLSACPKAHLVDICHEVAKQSVQHGAFMLRICHSYYPDGTIFLCVVDPGVGSRRRPVVVRSDRHYFIGPNNGLFTFAQAAWKFHEARVIENPKYLLPERSATFHGRDVFAPAAGHLAAGAPFADFGPVVDTLDLIPNMHAVDIAHNRISGRIIYIDSYGNLLTNVTPDMLPAGVDMEHIKLHFRGHVIQGISPHYAAVPMNHPLVYWGSSGFLEIGINFGSAARKWAVHPDEWFELQWK